MTALAVVAVLLACGARWLVRGEELARRRGRLFPESGRGRGALPGWARAVADRLVPAAEPALLVLPLGAVLGWLSWSPVPVLGALLAVVPLRRALRRRRAGRERERQQGLVAALCTALAGELRAGATPDQALLLAAGEQPGEPGRADLVAAARYTGDVPAAFRRLAAVPGAEGAAGIAACWQLAEERGAGLAAGLDRVAEGLRAERELCAQVRAELAGPRSTAALLAALPVFGLALGSALGADPLRVLLHTAGGLFCLALGGALEWAGLVWTARLVGGATAGPGR